MSWFQKERALDLSPGSGLGLGWKLLKEHTWTCARLLRRLLVFRVTAWTSASVVHTPCFYFHCWNDVTNIMHKKCNFYLFANVSQVSLKCVFVAFTCFWINVNMVVIFFPLFTCKFKICLLALAVFIGTMLQGKLQPSDGCVLYAAKG